MRNITWISVKCEKPGKCVKNKLNILAREYRQDENREKLSASWEIPQKSKPIGA